MTTFVDKGWEKFRAKICDF